MQRAEQERRIAMLRHRIELASHGVASYQKQKIAEAVKSFHAYIRILEDWKGVGEGGLSPNHFDSKLDIAELLLISGVYWDLAKLYDRTKSAERYKEFSHYLGKYVQFSKGMPFQVVCMETMRKYIGSEKTVHTREFKQAYIALGGKPCFVATSLADLTAPTTTTQLRIFRDQTLKTSRAGRAFTIWYYRHGPVLASRMDAAPQWVRVCAARALDFIARRV